ncbi:MAG: CxxC-x17-CxxC domain-containing protein [Candidatus Beckwithbacteria bacterium]
MGNFNRNSRPSGPRRDFGRGGFRDRQMHHAVCSNCGKDCEVPFEPTGSKPVYCRDCFEQNGGGGHSRRPDFKSPKNEQLESINCKLDKILEILTIKPKAKKILNGK